MSSTVPCLWFDGDGLAAAQRYVSLFPDSRIVSTSPGGPDGAPLTVDFVLDGRDWTIINGGPGFPQTEAFSVQVSCADQAEVDRCWDGLLADGGAEGRCGWLKDRWGVSWQVVPARLPELLSDPDPERAQRAMTAMLGMRRLVVAELEAAADGAGRPA
ncbi:VOC family protein [Kineococcus sp. LSe6-4]|uniref:VOC family protein n=1 Tax=Kineococcus halophytocola TaxID=3234027 RepID=A0ABV4H4U5_9ACTN